MSRIANESPARAAIADEVRQAMGADFLAGLRGDESADLFDYVDRIGSDLPPVSHPARLVRIAGACREWVTTKRVDAVSAEATRLTDAGVAQPEAFKAAARTYPPGAVRGRRTFAPTPRVVAVLHRGIRARCPGGRVGRSPLRRTHRRSHAGARSTRAPDGGPGEPPPDPSPDAIGASPRLPAGGTPLEQKVDFRARPRAYPIAADSPTSREGEGGGRRG
jgi:hypothetical protein